MTKQIAKDTRNERISRLEEKVALETLVKEDGAVRPEKNTAHLCRNETKRESHAKRTNCPPRREGCFGDLRERRRSCPPRRKSKPAVSIPVRKRYILDCNLQISRIIYCPLDRARPGGQHSQNRISPIGGLTPIGKVLPEKIWRIQKRMVFARRQVPERM